MPFFSPGLVHHSHLSRVLDEIFKYLIVWHRVRETCMPIDTGTPVVEIVIILSTFTMHCSFYFKMFLRRVTDVKVKTPFFSRMLQIAIVWSTEILNNFFQNWIWRLTPRKTWCTISSSSFFFFFFGHFIELWIDVGLRRQKFKKWQHSRSIFKVQYDDNL